MHSSKYSLEFIYYRNVHHTMVNYYLIVIQSGFMLEFQTLD